MKNYTPLNVKKEGSSDKLNVVLIIVAVLTALVLAGILVLMIQQKRNPPAQKTEQTEEEVQDNVVAPPPQDLESEEATPSPELQEGLDSTSEGILSPTPGLSPSVSPTP